MRQRQSQVPAALPALRTGCPAVADSAMTHSAGADMDRSSPSPLRDANRVCTEAGPRTAPDSCKSAARVQRWDRRSSQTGEAVRPPRFTADPVMNKKRPGRIDFVLQHGQPRTVCSPERARPRWLDVVARGDIRACDRDHRLSPPAADDAHARNRPRPPHRPYFRPQPHTRWPAYRRVGPAPAASECPRSHDAGFTRLRRRAAGQSGFD